MLRTNVNICFRFNFPLLMHCFCACLRNQNDNHLPFHIIHFPCKFCFLPISQRSAESFNIDLLKLQQARQTFLVYHVTRVMSLFIATTYATRHNNSVHLMSEQWLCHSSCSHAKTDLATTNNFAQEENQKWRLHTFIELAIFFKEFSLTTFVLFFLFCVA